MILLPQGQWRNKLRLKSQLYMFPVFKFGMKEHSTNLIEKGQVYLPTIHEFRDKTKYSDTVLDHEEGTMEITNKYLSYNGLSQNANGIARYKFPPNKEISLIDQTFTKRFDFKDSIIYCTAEYFFSESLNWALKQGKDSCVMIIDFEMFIDIISRHLSPEYLWVNAGSCMYTGRQITETDPTRKSVSNSYLNDPLGVLFTKPTQYKEQNEVRSVWKISSMEVKESTFQKFDIPILREFVLPINFQSINLEAFEKHKLGKGAFGTRVKRRDGKTDVFIQQTPTDMFSPICFLDKDGWKLGFRYIGEVHVYSDGYVRYAEPFFIGEIGPIFCLCNINGIESIEFFYDESFSSPRQKVG